jgi:hypothetical protein
MATLKQTALWCLPMILLLVSDVGSYRTRPQHRGEKRAKVAAANPKPTSDVDPYECSVPAWVISAAKTAINAGLKLALGSKDPWDYNIRNTSLELPLWGCTLKVNAETDLQVTGLSQVVVSDLQCMQSECVEDGWVSCAKYQHSLSATVDLGVIGILGTDTSVWECGAQLPRRDMSLSFEMHNYGMRADFKLNQTVLPPEGNVTVVDAVKTKLGESKNHKCTVLGIELGFLCGPQLEVITRILQGALKDVIDPAILGLLNYVLVPQE